MSAERFEGLVKSMCSVVGLPDAQRVLQTGALEIEGFEVMVNHYQTDPGAMYLNFHYGIVTPGRTLAVYRMMLEANLSIYAQDQAQLGMNADTGGIILIIRIPMTDDITGNWLADTLTHYTEHGRHWRNNIIASTDEMFIGICAGDYFWIRA